MNEEQLITRIYVALNQCLVELMLMSHANIAKEGDGSAHGKAESTGTSGPSGGLPSYAEELDIRQKSHEYFMRRAEKCDTPRELYEVLLEARAALKAWRKSPKPEKDWKDIIRASSASTESLSEEWGVSKTRIKEIRRRK